ncbi:MAG TPA: 50S ribosomal protein L3 [Phycisphaerae bacterium]|mgnify:CR=1 FL=1|nr:50S ribosomal protein L3 [Phycisphaerae bacterium]HRW53286.1 50S ribosomal protein L3 [Phycisphaerae bacterium]
MKAAILGTKVGMTRIFEADGNAIPVTVIQAGPCAVLQVKTKETDGYEAVQLGFLDKKPQRCIRPEIGHARKANSKPKRFVREIRLVEASDKQAGDVVTVGIFEDLEVGHVDIVGTTIGKGFQGVMKRHNFAGQENSHGVERKHRSSGGIGGHGNLGLGRGIKKGKRMSGHMGHDRVTSRNQKLVAVDKDRNLLLVKGGVPGPNGGFLVIAQAKAKK